MFEIYDGAQIRLTTARYYTPSGRCIQKSYDEGTEAYHRELQRRYEQGELVHPDSVNYPDSLKFYTSKGRVVYGGGGIMPDVFIPMDTLRLSDYFLSLRSAGVFNTFALAFADAHRSDTLYSDFSHFQQNFDSAAVMRDFADYAASKNITRSDVKGEWVASWMNDMARKTIADTTQVIHASNYEDYLDELLHDRRFLDQLSDKARAEDRRSVLINRHSDIYMGYMLKALIARNLYGIEYYYRVMRNYDQGLQEAIKAVKQIVPEK